MENGQVAKMEQDNRIERYMQRLGITHESLAVRAGTKCAAVSQSRDYSLFGVKQLPVVCHFRHFFSKKIPTGDVIPK